MSRFVDRNAKGRICGTYACKQREGQEELADDHPDLADFEKRIANPDLNLEFTDFVDAQVKKLDALVLAFVYERYPQHRQLTLSKLLTDSRLAGKKEATDYLVQCDDWLRLVFGAYYQLEDQIVTIAKNEGLVIQLRQIQIMQIIANARATVLDPLGASDPKITIRRSLELLTQ